MEPLQAFESEDFVVTLARGDTAESLAGRYLGDPAKAWMVEDYNGTGRFTAGRGVVLPRRPWNLSGVFPRGYQLVPILCYHNLGPQTRGRLLMSASAFEEQMRYLKREGYHVITLRQFLEFATLRRQLPRKDGRPHLRRRVEVLQGAGVPDPQELGFPATLFIYTDFIGARIALSWPELKDLATEGFDIQHSSLTRTCGGRRPSPTRYNRRMQAELVQPLAILQARVGQPVRILAYPYRAHDEKSSSACVMPATSPPWTSGARGTRRSRRDSPSTGPRSTRR